MSTLSPNRVAIITGAAGSFASKLVLCAAQNGWETVLIDKDQRALEQLYDQVVRLGGVEPLMHVSDLAGMDPQQCEDLLKALEGGPGRLDALIHCAVSFEGLQPHDQIAPHHWLRQMQVNLNAPWLLSVSCLPLLRRSPQASLYFLSEDLEKVAGAFWGAYGIAKHAIDTLASQLAAELSNTNIQVLSLNPGPMRSPLRARVYHTENPNGCADAAASASKVLHLMQRNLEALTTRVNLEELQAWTCTGSDCKHQEIR